VGDILERPKLERLNFVIYHDSFIQQVNRRVADQKILLGVPKN